MVGIGAGFDDGSVEGKPVDVAAQRRGSVKVFVHPEKDSLLAIAMEFFSSGSVRTWKRSSAPRRSSSI